MMILINQDDKCPMSRSWTATKRRRKKKRRVGRLYLSVVDVVVGGEGRRGQVAAPDHDRLARVEDVMARLNQDVWSADHRVLCASFTAASSAATRGVV